MICPRLSAPIVLAHGLFGFARLGVGPLSLRYFRAVPEFLRRGGNRVLVSRVHPTAGLGRRAWKLAQRIETAFGDEPVHVIGHSMGGLDARMLLADPAWSGRILSVTTVGTPHLGTALADAAGLSLGEVYRVLDRIGLDYRGFFDVTRRAARRRHRGLPAPGAVPCFSVAGDPPVELVSWPLRSFHDRLLRWEGPNDGMVALDSALAFGTPLAPCPLDHLAQVGWARPDRLEPTLALYDRVLERLAAVEEGAGHRCGAGVARKTCAIIFN